MVLDDPEELLKFLDSRNRCILVLVLEGVRERVRKKDGF
jgi:hypothetical protein